MTPKLSAITSAYDLYDTGRPSEERDQIAQLAQQVPSIVTSAADVLRKFREGASFTDPDLTADAIDRKRNEAHQAAQASRDALKTRASALDKLEAALRAGTGDDPTEPAEALLAELREQRAFGRLQREYGDDLSLHVDEIVARATESGDRATLSALKAELPSLMRSAFPGDERSAERSIATYSQVIDQAERPMLTPVARWHREALDEVATWRSAVNHNLGVLDHSLGDPSGATTYPMVGIDGQVMDASPGFEGMSGTSTDQSGGAVAAGAASGAGVE